MVQTPGYNVNADIFAGANICQCFMLNAHRQDPLRPRPIENCLAVCCRFLWVGHSRRHAYSL